jgi:hypothetical protein
VIAGEIFRYRAHREYFANEILPGLGSPSSSPAHFIGPLGRRLLSSARCLRVPSLVP